MSPAGKHSEHAKTPHTRQGRPCALARPHCTQQSAWHPHAPGGRSQAHPLSTSLVPKPQGSPGNTNENTQESQREVCRHLQRTREQVTDRHPPPRMYSTFPPCKYPALQYPNTPPCNTPPCKHPKLPNATPPPCKYSTFIQLGGWIRHFLRLCSIVAIHSGTSVGMLGWKGPYVPCASGDTVGLDLGLKSELGLGLG